MMRRIVAVERNAHWTFIRLQCGHSRAIGGHRLGTLYVEPVPLPPAHELLGSDYNCEDGGCCSFRNDMSR